MSILKKKKLLTQQSFEIYEEKNNKLYPECDASVWLRSCSDEIPEPMGGQVQGSIPKWLNGTLLRNGPGSLNVGDMQFHHLFDSAALLHKFDINNGIVSYQCRFIESESYKKNMAANRIVVTSYGTTTVPDPCHTIFQRISSLFLADPINDNSNISIYPFGDEFYTFTETPIIHRIDIDALKTTGIRDIRKYVGVVNHTSHPHIMQDGTAFNLGLSVENQLTQYNIIKFPKGEKMFENASVVAKLPARWRMNPSYMHSFATTEKYFIIIEQPLSISMIESIKAKYFKRPLASIFKWFQNECTLFHVICRKTGQKIQTFKTSAFFYLHTINAYDEEDNIVIDICCYRDPSVLDCMYVEAMKNMQFIENYANMFRSRPLRFIFPIDQRKVHVTHSPSLWSSLKGIIYRMFTTNMEQFLKKNQSTGLIIDATTYNQEFWNIFESNFRAKNLINFKKSQCRAYCLEDSSIFCIPERLCNLGCETPRINERTFLGRSYRYFYAISADVDSKIPGTIIKVDTKNKSVKTWNEYNVYPSEPIFVQAPGSKSEDDGVVLSAIIWGRDNTNRVGLLILCAKTMRELGRCVFETNGPVPKCLHGWYAPR